MASRKSGSPAAAVKQARQLQDEASALRHKADELEMQAVNLLAPAQCAEAARNIAGRKGRVAVFLGAGASFTFGFPLTKDLLPIILRCLLNRSLFEDARVNNKIANRKDRASLRKALAALCPGLEFTPEFLEENKFRLPLVTSLLSMLDFSLSAGQALISGLTPEEIKNARMLLERAIYEAIEYGNQTDSSRSFSRGVGRPTKSLTKWLDGLRPLGEVSVITSNYDVAVEKAWGFDEDNKFLIEDLAPDFGFDWLWPTNSPNEQLMKRPAKPLHRLYKLHGSTNWLKCGLCDRMYINPLVDIAIYAYERQHTFSNKCHCGHGKLEVQIVSPSFVREMRAPNLASIWQHALNWLRSADDWIVIGYSFPDEDLNIRSLFTRAVASRHNPPQVTAVQFGTSEQTRMRYEAFFPTGKLTFLTSGLQVFLDCVTKSDDDTKSRPGKSGRKG